MAFAHRRKARHPLLRHPLGRHRHDDAAGFASCCGPVSCFLPLRTPPLGDARGVPYRGPWRLPGLDFHQLAALSLSLGYVMKASLLSWRPSCWAHLRRALRCQFRHYLVVVGGEFELRVVGTKDAKGLSRWMRSFMRAAFHGVTEGWASKYAPVALQVVDRHTGKCVAEADFGRDLDGAEAARIGLADDLAALTLDEFCATYHFDRCANG